MMPAVVKDQLPLIVLLLLVLVVSSIDSGFMAPGNLLVVTADTMTLFLMAAGATFVIMTGGIDLSIQAVASMTSCIVAALLPKLGFTAVPITLLAGAVFGVMNGLVTTKLRIPSFVATLAVSGVATSVAFLVSDARSVLIAAADRDAYLAWAVGDLGPLQNEILVGLVVLIGLTLLYQFTTFGRFIRAIGSQEQAVIASGIHADRIKILAFILSGTMAGLAGVVMAGRLGSGSPTLANEFLLPAIACIIVGGTAITGGVGSVWRTFIGALIIAVVRIGMTFIGVSVFAQQIVFGLILVAAVAITMDRSKVATVK
ncbi:MAG: ABC transporter permease [Pseudomonadota bacterium]